jgi:predicted dinucleotide-utilizing enzyme
VIQMFNRISVEIEILRLSAGDLVAFKTDMMLSAMQVKEIKQHLKKQLPDGVDVIVISGGSLEVTKAEERQP